MKTNKVQTRPTIFKSINYLSIVWLVQFYNVIKQILLVRQKKKKKPIPYINQ
jgi:hypothetical protein